MQAASTAARSTLEQRVQTVLKDNRGVVMYTNYRTSEEHRTRIAAFPGEFRVPREQWMSHKNWRRGMQMPNFHIGFR